MRKDLLRPGATSSARWEPTQRSDFLVAAYEEACTTAHAIRERQLNNARLVITLLIAGSGFLLTTGSTPIAPLIRWLAAAGFALLGLSTFAIAVVHGKHLRDVLYLRGNLERAMEFHTSGSYISGTLYGDQTVEKLIGRLDTTGRAYILVVAAGTIFAVVTAVLPLFATAGPT